MYHSRLTSALAMAALAAILVPSSLTAQITFERTYGGTSTDGAYSVTQTADGGYIITGWTCLSESASVDVYLVRTDSLGDTLWTRTYGGPIDDWGTSVQQTTDGGYVITGVADNVNGVCADVYLIKTDSLGDTMWTRKCGGSDDDKGYSVQQTADGGYVVAGATYSFGQGYGNLYLLKFDVNGDTTWTRTYCGEDHAYGSSVQQTADGGYIVAGTTSFDVYLVKTNVSGDTMWTRTYGDTNVCRGNCVQHTTDGGYIVAGSVLSSFTGYDFYLVKTDSLGDALWTRTFGGDSQDMGRSVWQTADGDYVITGWTYSCGAGAGDVYLIKTDPNGDTQWSRTYGGADGDFGNAAEQTDDGGYIIAGETDSYGADYRDVYLIKTDSLGMVDAVEEPKASPTRASDLTLTCTPNPASGSVTISLSPSIPLSLSPVLRIYDSQGRMVLSRDVATSSFHLSTSDLPSGAYFVRLDAAGEHATTRIVLQR